MVESALRHIKIFENLNYFNIKVSLKASKVRGCDRGIPLNIKED